MRRQAFGCAAQNIVSTGNAFSCVPPTAVRREAEKFLTVVLPFVFSLFCSAADRQRTTDKLYLVLEKVSALVAAGVDKVVGVSSA